MQAEQTGTLPHASVQPAALAKPWLSLRLPVSDGGSDLTLVKVTDELANDRQALRAIYLARGGPARPWRR